MQNLILAAGLASRSKGEKLLFPYKGTTIIAHAVSQSLQAGLKTIVVTGFQSEQIRQALSHISNPLLKIVHNEFFENGQGSSTICAAAYLDRSESFFISLADMPLIESHHYEFLMQRAKESVVRPSYKGRLGHPVLLDPSFIPIILAQDSSFTMRQLLKDYPVQAIDVSDQAYVFDIDTPEAYQYLLSIT